jgi:hypothetical protein
MITGSIVIAKKSFVGSLPLQEIPLFFIFVSRLGSDPEPKLICPRNGSDGLAYRSAALQRDVTIFL